MKKILQHIAFRFAEKIFRFIHSMTNKKIFTTYKNLKLKLSFENAFYSGLLFYGVIDRYETALLEKILHPGDITFDVGAFVDGWYTLLPAVIVERSGHVYSFEPVPTYYKRLKENIALNKLTNITLINKAVYNKAKKMTFYVADARSSVLRTQAESYKDIVPYPLAIQTITLDSFVTKHNIKKVNFIKIDVEGVEMDVLKGCVHTLKKYHPHLLIEIVNKQLQLGGSSRREVIQFLKKLGYIPYAFSYKGIVRYSPKVQLRSNNLIFTTQKKFV